MTMARLADKSAVAAINRALRLVACLQLFHTPTPGQDVDALYPLCYTPTCRGHMPVSYVFRPLQTKKMILEDRAVPIITFVRENMRLEVPDGDHVRYPALENDVPVYCGLWKYANCHGNGLCGTDRVAVSPSTNTNDLTFMERFWLRSDLKKNPNIRLACQVEVYGDVTVDTQCKS